MKLNNSDHLIAFRQSSSDLTVLTSPRGKDNSTRSTGGRLHSDSAPESQFYSFEEEIPLEKDGNSVGFEIGVSEELRDSNSSDLRFQEELREGNSSSPSGIKEGLHPLKDVFSAGGLPVEMARLPVEGGGGCLSPEPLVQLRSDSSAAEESSRSLVIGDSSALASVPVELSNSPLGNVLLQFPSLDFRSFSSFPLNSLNSSSDGMELPLARRVDSLITRFETLVTKTEQVIPEAENILSKVESALKRVKVQPVVSDVKLNPVPVEPALNPSLSENSSSAAASASAAASSGASASAAESSAASAASSFHPYQDFKSQQIKKLTSRHGSAALSEINLLDSGNCVVKKSDIFFIENKNTKSQDGILIIDYEVSPSQGPLQAECSTHKVESDPNQYLREQLSIDSSGFVRLLSRQIVTNTSVVGVPTTPLYASITPRTESVFHTLFVFSFLVPVSVYVAVFLRNVFCFYKLKKD